MSTLYNELKTIHKIIELMHYTVFFSHMIKPDQTIKKLNYDIRLMFIHTIFIV